MLQELLLPAHLSTARTPMIPRHCLSWQSPPQCLVCLDSLFSLLIKIQKCLILQWALLFVCFILFYFFGCCCCCFARNKTQNICSWTWNVGQLKSVNSSRIFCIKITQQHSWLGPDQYLPLQACGLLAQSIQIRIQFATCWVNRSVAISSSVFCIFVMIQNRASWSLSCDNRKEQTQTHSQPLQLSHRPREN